MTPVLIDTDPGIDDALALLLAWGSPEVQVAAITTVAGNVPLAQATMNTRRLLALRRPDPPPRLAAGAEAPLARPLVTATRYHGVDGLGDIAGWPEVQRADTEGTTAPDLIVEMARRHRGELTVVALGPLTNLAHALAADRQALRGVGRVVAMGGAVDVPGNVTPAAEFNCHVDPEAATAVFAAGLVLDLVPLDATRQAVLPRSALETALAARPGPVSTRIAALSARGFRQDLERGERGMILHDPLAVGVAVDPTLVGWEGVRIEIGADGETRRVPGAPNCRVARAVDTPRFLSMLLARLCP